MKRFLLCVLVVLTSVVFAFGLISCKKKKAKKPVEYNEQGVYYCDVEKEEYLLTLNDGDTFTLVLGEESKAGDYTYDGATLTLKFTGVKEKTTATLVDNVVSLEYEGGSYRFLRKIVYTVTYDVDGGSAVEADEVVNGRTLAKPQDPVKEGYDFIGWYADEEFSKPYAFGSAVVTENTVLYARFAQKVAGGEEFTATLFADPQNGAFAIERTLGGVLYDLPVAPNKDGKAFLGWWLSDYQNPDKLTAKYEGQTLKENVNLYAVWDGALPVPSVSGSEITWNAKDVNSSYTVKITSPSGAVLNGGGSGESTPSTTYPFDFSNLEAGDYKVELTYKGETTTAYYKNKALARVSLFTVSEPSMLLFNRVENATKYTVSVDCGNPDHVHTQVNNGTSTYYNFVNCDMQEGGIVFTVKAEAAGFAPSEATFVYERKLAKVDGLKVEENDRLVWNKVSNATSYVVNVKVGESIVYSENVGTSNFFSLKGFTGEFTVEVRPFAKGYNSPAATTIVHSKANLATPSGIKFDGKALSWNAVENATGYNVMVGAELHSVSTNTLSASVFAGVQDTATVSVQAVGATESVNSLYSDELTIKVKNLGEISYENGVLTFGYVFNATKYGVKVEDEEEFFVENGLNHSPVTLVQAGVNEITVRALTENGSELCSATTEVFAYEIEFDVCGGVALRKQYKALGDMLILPEPSNPGNTFHGWYNVPGGAAVNGLRYADGIFQESGNIILYAQWKPVTLTVSFNIGQEGELNVSSLEIPFKSEYSLPVPTATTPGKLFGGWFESVNGVGRRFTDENGIASEPWNVPNDITLYARWLTVLEFDKHASGEGYNVVAGPDIAFVTTVTVPQTYAGETVKAVPATAFANCSQLESILLPDTIELITLGLTGSDNVSSAFTGCMSLEKIDVYCPNENEHHKHNMYYDDIDGVLIRYNQVSDETELAYIPAAYTTTSFRVPYGVEVIPGGFFQKTPYTEVVFPSTVTTIGTDAFWAQFFSDSKIESVIFEPAPMGQEEVPLTIQSGAFERARNLINITLPARVKELAFDAFYDCLNLENIHIEGNGYGADGIKTFSSQDGVIATPDGRTLLYCPLGKQGVYVADTKVSKIADGAFKGGELNGIKLPYVTEIGKEAFADSELSSVEFGTDNSLPLTIKESAFYGTKLEEVTLPANLKRLEKYAFGYVYLKRVTVNATTGLTFENEAFANTSGAFFLSELHLGPETEELEINGIFGNRLKTIVVDPANPNYASDNAGVLFNKAMTKIVCYPAGKTDPSYDIPDTVTEISSGVFSGKLELVTITVGAAVQSLGDNAFAGCRKLETVTIDSGTASLTLGNNVFAGCEKLKAVSLPARVSSIGDGAFSGCKLLQTLDLSHLTQLKTIGTEAFKDCEKITSFVVPEGVTTVGDKAFSGCIALTSVSLPSTLTKMGTYTNDTLVTLDAFEGCVALVTLTVANGNAKFATKDGVLFNGDKSELYFCPANNAGNEGVLDLPNTLTRIWPRAFAANEGVRKIIFSQGINSPTFTVGASAFSGNSTLKEVDLPEGLAEVSENMFYGCPSLEKVYIPATVTLIKNRAFGECESLTTVTFDTTKTYILDIEDVTSGQSWSGSMTYNYYDAPFYGCDSLTTIQLPEGTKKIGACAFYGIRSLNMITIPSTVEVIGAQAFSSAFGDGTTEKELVIPESVKTLGEQAFYGSGITKATIKMSGETIGMGAFSASDLNSVDISQSNVKTIAAEAFEYCDITTFVWNDMVTSIGDLAFYGSAFGEFVLPATVKTIGNEAFKYGEEMTSFSCAAGSVLEKIGDGAFWRCESLVTVTLPASIKTIGANAFYYCSALTSVNFLEDVTTGQSKLEKIGNEAFAYTALTSFTFPETAKVITSASFGGPIFKNCTELTTINLSSTVASFEGALDYCSSISTITVASDSENFKVAENNSLVLLNKAGDTVVYISGLLPAGAFDLSSVAQGITRIGPEAFVGQTQITSVVFPASLITIGESAFENCTALTSLEFANGCALTTVDAKAFKNCALTSLSIPAEVTSIGAEAFYGNLALASVTFNEKLTTTGASAFANCTSLISVTLPVSLTKIGDKMFESCTSLSSVTLPDEMEKLGKYMFRYCSALTSIRLPALLEDTNSYTFEGTALESVTVPQYVSEIGTASFRNIAALETVIFEGVIAEIGKQAFKGCTSLTTISFPEGLGVIDDNAFENCTALANIVLPGSLVELGKMAFANCGMTTITIPAVMDMGEGAFSLNAKLNSVTFTAGTVIGKKAFENCTAITSLTLPEIAVLGDEAFAGCTLLSSVTFDETTTELSKGLFRNCTSLESLTLPENVVFIGTEAFADSGLKTLEVPAGITVITDAFSDARALEELTFKGVVTEVEDFALENCESLLSLDLPHLVTVGRYAFSNCKSMVSINIPKVAVIEDAAFSHCESLVSIDVSGVALFGDGSDRGTYSTFAHCYALESITLNGSLTELPSSMFEYCTSLTTLTLPATLEDIPYQFMYNAGVETITLPNALTAIGSYAFCESSLTAIEIPTSVTYVGMYAFYGTKLTQVEIPASVEEIETSAFGKCLNLLSILVDPANPAYQSDSQGLLYDRINEQLLVCPAGVSGHITVMDGMAVTGEAFSNCTQMTSVTLATPKTNSELEFRAFENCVLLESITIPEGYTAIGSDCFAGCTALSEVVLPTTLKEIDYDAFNGCTALTEIDLPSGLQKIGSHAFENTGLTSISIPASVVLGIYDIGVFMNNAHLASVTFEDGFTRIEEAMFSGCPMLTSVVIPSSVVYVGESAFGKYSDNMVTEVYAEASGVQTVTIKGAPSFGDRVFFDCDSLKTVIFEGAIQELGDEMFRDCDNLESIVIPNTVTDGGYEVFMDCDKLTSVTLSTGMSSLGDGYFSNCVALSTIEIPANITELSYECFIGCTAMTSIYLPLTVSYVANYVFYGWTENQTIRLACSEEYAAANFRTYWNSGCNATVLYEQAQA